MTEVTATELAQNLLRYLDEAAGSDAPLVITREGKPNVVLVAEHELNGWKETAYLLSSPRNAERLLDSIRRADAGQTEEHELLQPTATSDA